jgi:hypothetical protein
MSSIVFSQRPRIPSCRYSLLGAWSVERSCNAAVS